MKGGLAIVLGGLKPKGGSKGPPDGATPDDEAAEGEEPAGDAGSEKQFAKVAAEALADGDTEAAADALVSMVKACIANYG